MEPITSTTIMTGALAWVGNKLLGPTAEVVGSDLKTLYEIGKNKIALNAIKKVKDIDLPGQTNLRVTRDVFWNGSFTDEAICAEYFGGILAASRSVDGKDDTGVFYVDIIKSLSSGQLKMHYIIYRVLNKLLISDETKRELNPGQEQELGNLTLVLPLSNILEQFKNQDVGAILHGLNGKGLIGNFQTQYYKIDVERSVYYLEVSPKSLGVQLFAIANNKLDQWRGYAVEDFGDFDDVVLPTIYAYSINDLFDRAGLKPENIS